MSTDKGRLGRMLALVGLVSVAFLLTAAHRFGIGAGTFPIAAAAIGSIAFVTAVFGFLIAVETDG